MDKIWLDGELVDWDDANIHVLTHTLHYGLGVFEGVRAYKQHDGTTAIFRLEEHTQRLFDSARICMMPMEFSEAEVSAACKKVVRVNGLEDCYIRPIAFAGDGAMGLGAKNTTRLAIIAWRWGSYLGADGIANGIRAKVSSFARPGVNALMAKGKICGHYVNSILANREVTLAGYQEAILLDAQGYVSEGAGENIFVIRDGEITTPSLGSSILAGITRATILEIVKDFEIPLSERRIARDELYLADEIFMVGTAAEVTPVREIDDRTIGSGSRGPLTEKIQARYFEIVRGVDPLNAAWNAQVSQS